MNKKILHWADIRHLVKMLSVKVQQYDSFDKVEDIYGIPRGGQFVALLLSQVLDIPLAERVGPNTLVVDDIVDSGRTITKFHSRCAMIASLHVKPHTSIMPHAFVEKTSDWIVYPWESINNETIQNNITRTLELIGENPNREGLVDTPNRVAKMYGQLFCGYDSCEKPKVTVFPNGRDGIIYDEMLTDEGSFYSQCEHHLAPFFGRYYFGYIPNKKGKILGLSKVARIIDYHCSKLQIQERIVAQVVDDLWKALDDKENPPLGMMLVMKGKHLCKSMRGVKKEGYMTSSEIRGVFKGNPATRMEFFELIKLKGSIE